MDQRNLQLLSFITLFTSLKAYINYMSTNIYAKKENKIQLWNFGTHSMSMEIKEELSEMMTEG